MTTMENTADPAPVLLLPANPALMTEHLGQQLIALVTALAPNAVERSLATRSLAASGRSPVGTVIADRRMTDAGERVVPNLRQVLDELYDLWRNQLDPADQLAERVHTLRWSPLATPISEVLAAIRLADQLGLEHIATPEYTSLTFGEVSPGDQHQWLATVGTGPDQILLGDYGSIQAAEAAVWDDIALRRDRLRARLRESVTALVALADRGWRDPQVLIRASVERRSVQDTDLVTISEIAHKARVRRTTVDQWLLRHKDLPRPVVGSLRQWSDVRQWLTDTNRVPKGGFADSRAVVESDARF